MDEKILSEIKMLNSKIDIIMELLKKTNNYNIGAPATGSDNLKSQIEKRLARARQEIELKVSRPSIDPNFFPEPVTPNSI